MKYTYNVEAFGRSGWFIVVADSRDFCLGYLRAKLDLAPRLAHRVIRSDGVVISEVHKSEEVSVGQVAGYPSAEQYEEAAKRALAMAAKVREISAKQAKQP